MALHIRVWGMAALAGVALMACDTARAGNCDPATIGYVQSRLDLDYRSLAPSPVAEILSRAEAERLAAAGELSAAAQADLAAKWRLLVERLLAGTLAPTFTGTASEPSLDELRALTPAALALLRSCAPDADPRLAYLRDISLSVGGGQE
jgi:hypothetical protein